MSLLYHYYITHITLLYPGITGTVAIDEYGDKRVDYTFLDMNPHSGIFQVPIVHL